MRLLVVGTLIVCLAHMTNAFGYRLQWNTNSSPWTRLVNRPPSQPNTIEQQSELEQAKRNILPLFFGAGGGGSGHRRRPMAPLPIGRRSSSSAAGDSMDDAYYKSIEDDPMDKKQS